MYRCGGLGPMGASAWRNPEMSCQKQKGAADAAPSQCRDSLMIRLDQSEALGAFATVTTCCQLIANLLVVGEALQA